MARFLTALRLVVPSIWAGMIIAIDLIEAPLKFQAPGITIPLGLGIGRLVFTAMNAVEVVLFVLFAVALWRTSAPVRDRWIAGALGMLLLVKIAVLRPLMAARTDAVIAGTGDPGSFVHFGYIGVDAVIGVLLLWIVIRQCRQLVDPRPAVPTAAR